jgi:hypothetical protein
MTKVFYIIKNISKNGSQCLPTEHRNRKNNFNVAETKYCQELQKAITICEKIHANSRRKLMSILPHFNSKEQELQDFHQK